MSQALTLAASPGIVLAAGCTDLLPATQDQILPGPVLDLSAIAGLRGISRDAGGWRFGATTTWTDVIAADLPPAFDGLKAAAREVGSVQIQNAGTIGGNLCNASPAADGVPALLSLEAQVELRSQGGSRVLPLSDFLIGPRRTARTRGEILSAVLIPDVAGQGGFLKLGARRYLVISIAMVAARIAVSEGRISAAALAVGACSPVACRLPAQEAALIGCPVDAAVSAINEALILPELAPIDDPRADAGYRQVAAVELLRRLVGDITGVAR